MAGKKGLRLQPLSPKETRKPPWNSYQLVTSMGIVRVSETSLLAIRLYLERLR
jgi:hypothetical protein